MRPLFLLIICMFPLFGDIMEGRVQVLENKMKEAGTKTNRGGFGANFASGEFEKGWVGPQLFGGPLYWQAKVEAAECAYDFTTKGEGKVEPQSFGWGWGYRIGASLRLPILKWEIIGTYTHFGTQDHEGRGIIPPSLLASLKGGRISSSQEATSDYKIDYNNIDLVLHRSSFLSRFFGLGSSIGVKRTWIDQKQGVSYRGETLVRVKDRCCFVGTGPSFGFTLKWHLIKGISFLTDANGSLLYGEFVVKHSESQIALKGNAHFFSPTLRFLLGLNWDYPMNWAQISLSLGYEAEYFWRQNQVVEIENKVSNGLHFQLVQYADDLTFYGATLRARIEF